MTAFDGGIFVLGDSKSSSDNSWPDTLSANTSHFFVQGASNGANASGLLGVMTARIALCKNIPPSIVLLNIGVNDFGLSSGDQAAWTADMQGIMDAVWNKWPGRRIPIYVAKPWARGFDTKADMFSGWIDTLVSDNVTAGKLAFVGHDERSWLKGGDNGTTNTTDGIHYSAAGEAARVSQGLQ